MPIQLLVGHQQWKPKIGMIILCKKALGCGTVSDSYIEVFTQHRTIIVLVLTYMTMPVVLCTGFSEIMDEKKARKMGIDSYMIKPVIQRQLAQTIYEALQQKGERRLAP